MSDFAMKCAMKKRAQKMAYGGSADEGPSEKANQSGVNKILPTFHRENKEVRHGSSEASIGSAETRKSEHKKTLNELRSMPKPNLPMAEGGMTDCEHGGPEHCAEGCYTSEEEASGYEPMPMSDDDMVGRVMAKRQRMFSKGGQVANDSEPTADSQPNEFDDLVLRDELEGGYTGANSGDEIGNEAEDKDRMDPVARVMMKRRKQHNPNPA